MALAVDFTKHQAEIVAWACFVTGGALLVVGLVIALFTTFKTAKTVVNQVNAKLSEARAHVQNLETTAVAAAGTESPNTALASQATTAADAAKGSLGDIGTIIGSLPEAMRFPGLLILVGALLMSVATVQFGGHSIF